MCPSDTTTNFPHPFLSPRSAARKNQVFAHYIVATGQIFFPPFQCSRVKPSLHRILQCTWVILPFKYVTEIVFVQDDEQGQSFLVHIRLNAELRLSLLAQLAPPQPWPCSKDRHMIEGKCTKLSCVLHPSPGAESFTSLICLVGSE